MRTSLSAAIVAVGSLSAAAAAAQPTTTGTSTTTATVTESSAPGVADTPLEALSAQMVDPTAPLLAVYTSLQWIASFHDAPGNADTLRFRAVVPLEAFGYQNILQADLGYLLDVPGEGGDGLAPTRLSDWVVLPYAWGRLAIGATAALEPGGMNVPRAADGRLMTSDDGRLQLGPSVAAVIRRGPWTFGAINHNLLGDNQAVTLLQPVVAYALSPTLTVGAGELALAYDWGDDALTSIPIGVQVDKIVVVAGQPLRLSAQPIYNLDSGTGQPAWTVVLGVGVLAAAVE